MTFSFSDTNVTENVTEKREYQILKILQSNQTITTNELAEKYNVSRRTIASDIDNIKTSPPFAMLHKTGNKQFPHETKLQYVMDYINNP